MPKHLRMSPTRVQPASHGIRSCGCRCCGKMQCVCFLKKLCVCVCQFQHCAMRPSCTILITTWRKAHLFLPFNQSRGNRQWMVIYRPYVGNVWVICGVFDASATCNELGGVQACHGRALQRPSTPYDTSTHPRIGVPQWGPLWYHPGDRGLRGSYVGYLMPVRLAAGLFRVLGCHHSATQHPWRP